MHDPPTHTHTHTWFVGYLISANDKNIMWTFCLLTRQLFASQTKYEKEEKFLHGAWIQLNTHGVRVKIFGKLQCKCQFVLCTVKRFFTFSINICIGIEILLRFEGKWCYRMMLMMAINNNVVILDADDDDNDDKLCLAWNASSVLNFFFSALLVFCNV